MAESEPRASSRIFISYRREDTTGFVRALVGPLSARFGRNRVFKDTDNISPGQDFVKAIQRELESCKVLLAVIGNEWTTVQDARTKERRLDNPSDTLRIEIAAALKNEQITVIPVLVDRAPMPRAEDLPDDLSELARRNAFELSDARWESDVERLANAIDQICEVPQPQPQTRAEQSASGFQRLELKRQRQLAEHLKTAREAFDAEDHQAVLAACERAVWLDPQDPEARDLATRAQAAIDQKDIQQRLDLASKALAAGDLPAASEAIDHALARSPDNPTAIKLRQDLLRARFERDRQAEVTRQAAAELASAQSSLEDEDFPAALSHVEEALTLVPDSREALDLKAKVVAARAESVRLRDLKRRAQQAVADAEAAWSAGKQDDALAQLSAFSPPHELVSKTLEELRAKATDAARVASAADAEAAALARRDADARLAMATTAVAEKRYEAAQQLIDEARQIDPAHPDVPAWGKRIADAIAADAAAAQAKRDRETQAAHEAAERQAALARETVARARRDASAKLALAAAAVKGKQYDAAREHVESARQIDAGHPDLEAWVTRIADAIAADAAADQARREREAQAAREEAERQAAHARKTAERARRDADAKLALAAAAVEDKRYDAAEKFVDAARLIEPGHPRLAEHAARISDAIAADVAADQARQEQEAEVARAKAAAAKEAADRARRDADAKLALASTAVDAKRYDAAKKLVDAARVIDPGHPDLAGWAARIRDGVAADAAAERATEEPEARRKVGADRKHTTREAEDQQRPERVTAGAPPAWIAYLVAAAVVLVVAISAASYWMRADPPASTEQPPPATGSSTPAPAPPPVVDTPVQPESGRAANAGADQGSQPTGPKEIPEASGPTRAGRGTEQAGGPRSRGPETSRPGTGTGRESEPVARGGGTSTAPKEPGPTPPPEGPASSGSSPPAGRGTGAVRSGGTAPGETTVKPAPDSTAGGRGPGPSVPTPPPPTAKTPEELLREQEQKQVAADVTAIKGLLKRYATAYSTLEDRRVREVDPNFSGIRNRELIRKVTLEFQEPIIAVRGRSATLLAAVTFTYEWNRAGFPPTSPGTITWNLQKDGDTWKVLRSN